MNELFKYETFNDLDFAVMYLVAATFLYIIVRFVIEGKREARRRQ